METELETRRRYTEFDHFVNTSMSRSKTPGEFFFELSNELEWDEEEE